MLVLTRKLQQQIKIGDNITVTILKVKGSAVSIGIDAPREIHIVRSELPPEAVQVYVVPQQAQADNHGHEQAREPLVQTDPPAEKSSIQARTAHARQNPRFNMPPLKLAVSVPTLAK